MCIRDSESIARVTLADAHAFDAHGGLALSADLATEAALVLELEDGAKLTGLAVYELQAESSRVGDFLEAAGDFFPFFHDDRVSYVNKRKIAQVHLQPSKE